MLLDIAFSPAPNGLGLHRVAADVQPANERSAALLRSLGFVREGHSPRMVRIPTAGDPRDDWRDHDRYALLREDWPASPYAAPAPPVSYTHLDVYKRQSPNSFFDQVNEAITRRATE